MDNKRGSSVFAKLQESGRTSLLVCGIISTVVFVSVCAFSLFMTGGETLPFFGSPSYRITEGWTDDSGKAVTLPEKFQYPQGGVYTLRTTVPELEPISQDLSIMFAAKYLNVTLFVDGEEIGSCIGKPEGAEKLAGKIYLTTSLPGNSAGKELKLVAVPLLGEEVEYEINAPTLGTGERLVYELIKSDLSMLMVLEAIFCFGFLLILFSWQSRKTGNSTFFPTGLFAILFAMYSLCITDTIHLFFNNPQFIYLMEFLLLALSPMPLLILVSNVCLPKFRPAILADIAALTINFCLQTGLYFFTSLELRDTVVITHIVLGVSVLLLVPVLALSGRQGGERFRLLVSFSPVLIGAAWDIARFYFPGTYQKAVAFQFGVLCFIIFQTFYLVRSYLESDLYRKVAYTDALTGLENRTAFEDKIVQLGKTVSNYASVWCVCADVNSLKEVNDTLGHSAGDELIRGAAKVLREAKSKDSYLYRTGGDEFVLFEFNQTQESMEEWTTRLDTELSHYAKTHGTPLSIAVGYDCLGKGDTMTKLISRADSIMYEDKHNKKDERNREPAK